MPTLIKVPVVSITPSERARPINQDLVAELARSIEVSGLIQPAVVRPVGDGEHPNYQLIAGHHRFRAVRDILKKETILCIVRTLADLEAELVEIDENLLRAPLSPVQEAVAQSRRKEIYTALHPQTRAGVAGAAARHGDANDTLSYAHEAAKALRTTARTVQRHVARGAAISGELADKISGTSLDTGVELDSLAKLAFDQQAELVDRAAAGETVSARKLSKGDASEVVSTRERVLAADFGKQIFRGCTALIEEDLATCSADEAESIAAALEISQEQTFPPDIVAFAVHYAAQLLCMGILKYAKDPATFKTLDTDILFGPRLPASLRPTKLRRASSGSEVINDPSTASSGAGSDQRM